MRFAGSPSAPGTRPDLDVDLAVIGGGPAGSACAIAAARRGLSTVLFDRPRSPGGTPCGEGIMPAGVDALRSLGLHDLLARGRRFDGMRHVVAGAAPLEVDVPRPGLAVRRDVLAAALDAALAAESVRRVESTARAARTATGAFVVETPVGDVVRAATLVVADGRASRTASALRRAPAPAPDPSTRFGLRARFHERATLDRVEVHMGRGCEIYLTPLPDREVNVAVLFERPPRGPTSPPDLLAWALDRHPAAAAHLSTLTTPPSGRALPEGPPRAAADRGAFLAGDALGAVDPILGCGVTIALRTGVLAARGAHAIVSGARRDAVAVWYGGACRRERRARHALASFLRLADRRPRLARFVATTLGRLPGTARAMARVAAGR